MTLYQANFIRQKSFYLTVRGRQIINRNKTSYPYISGDSFADACDISIYGQKTISTKQIEAAQSIFCSSDKLEEFLTGYRHLIKAKILVFGNSDRDFYELGQRFPESVQKVYLQNSHISDDFFHTLPIGIENLRHGRNGQKSLFRSSFASTEKFQKILVGPFSPTHPERAELNSWSNIQHPRLHAVTEYLKPKSLAALASTFKFIACPRGNGTDTHRFWESLYRGSIPVVKRSMWSQSINQLGIPVVQLDSWDFEEFLERSEAFTLTQIKPELLDLLWMKYWEKIFCLDIK